MDSKTKEIIENFAPEQDQIDQAFYYFNRDYVRGRSIDETGVAWFFAWQLVISEIVPDRNEGPASDYWVERQP